jgi:hypothetical protein
MGLYVHGKVLGVETKGKQDKKFNIIHVLEGYEKNEVLTNRPVEYKKDDAVQIPVRPFKDKLYRVDAQ